MLCNGYREHAVLVTLICRLYVIKSFVIYMSNGRKNAFWAAQEDTNTPAQLQRLTSRYYTIYSYAANSNSADQTAQMHSSGLHL